MMIEFYIVSWSFNIRIFSPFFPSSSADVWTVEESLGRTRRLGLSRGDSLEQHWNEPIRYH
jgi:hypothetical protein